MIVEKVVNRIPLKLRNKVPQKVRNIINGEINHIRLKMDRFLFLINKQKRLENSFRKAIEIEYDNYRRIGGGELPHNAGDLLILPRIVISVSNRCTLRCKDCNALVPYFKNRRDIPVNEIIDIIDKIFSVVDICINVEVIGGEPFLYRELDTVLNHLVEKSQIYSIEVTTNGTVELEKSVIEALKNNKIYVFLSDYEAVNKDIKKEMLRIFQENSIKYEVLNMDSWIDAGNYDKRNKSRNEICWQYFRCTTHMHCKTLWEGKLFACGRAPAIFDLCNLTDKSSYLDFKEFSIDNKEEIRNKIKEFYLSEYAECCDFCDYAAYPLKQIKGGEQLIHQVKQ